MHFIGETGCRAFLLAAILFFALAVPAHAEDDPAGHIKRIGEAVDNADSQAFLRLVDLDSILNNALAAFISEAKKPENATQLPPILALMFGQLAGDSQSAAGMRALLVGEARTFVVNGIDSGAFGGRKPDLSRAKGMLAPLFANASLGRKEIRQIGKPQRNGGSWIVPFTVHDHDNGHDYNVLGRLERKDNCLVLDNIENLEDLIRQIGEEGADMENG